MHEVLGYSVIGCARCPALGVERVPTGTRLESKVMIEVFRYVGLTWNIPDTEQRSTTSELGGGYYFPPYMYLSPFSLTIRVPNSTRNIVRLTLV